MKLLPIETINEVFYRAISRGLDKLVMSRKNGIWEPLSSVLYYHYVGNTARALNAWGVKKGDRVIILSENRSEWGIADFACLLIGAVDVPLYATLTAEQSAYIVKDSGARIAFVSTREQLKKLKSISGTSLETIVIMDDVGGQNAVRMQQIMGAGLPSQGRDADFDRAAQSIRPDDLATIIYTSGTTGTPKGVMLTHGNIASNLNFSVDQFGWTPGQLSISFLPLSHVTARHVDYCFFNYGVTIAYCPDFNQLPQTIQEIRPHIFVAVPRVYEKLRQEAQRRTSGSAKARVLAWALDVGRKHRETILQGRKPLRLSWRLADLLVYSKLREAFGGRVNTFISGGAPLGFDTAAWYADMGIRIFEGYGLTETSPVIAVNNCRDHKIGTVGKPLENLECKIAADGELLVRGPSIFKGYWNLPDETKNAFADGWFKTGDVAGIDEEGFLSITDRKKDLIKTSGGKFIAPQPIEGILKNNVLIAHAAVIGERRKFASVIIAPHFTLLEDWARVNGIRFSNRQELVNDAKVHLLYEGIVAEVNKKLAQFEKLKRVLLVAEEFSIASGELTPSLKLKRRVVEEKYKQQIDHLYDAASYATPEAAAIT